MKTAELIPIILYQLVDGDRYGYEIIKQIEDKSNGGIVIKQPTLYSVLKKLEQGRFITSYWEDSEIGGKRHYYKLTDNGRAQLDTYPAFEDLIKDALQNEGFEPSVVNSSTYNSSPIPSEEIMPFEFTLPDNTSNLEASFDEDLDNSLEDVNDSADEVVADINNIEVKPIDLTSPSNLDTETFKEIAIEPIISNDMPTFQQPLNKVELETTPAPTNITTNTNNITIDEVKPSPINIFDAIDYDNGPASAVDNEKQSIINSSTETTAQENISTEQQTPKFAEKVDNIEEPYVVNKLYDKLTPNIDLIKDVKNSSLDKNLDSSPIEPIETVKYLNYVDFSKDKDTLKRKKIITKHIQKMTATCITLLLLLICSLLVCNKYSFSKVYYLSAIVVGLIIILYPVTLISRLSKLRFKYCSCPFRYSISRDFFVKLSLFLSLIITIFAYNLTINDSISAIFKINNFANFGAIILFSLVSLLDFVYSILLYKKYTK